jgi:hypothetical protein
VPPATSIVAVAEAEDGCSNDHSTSIRGRAENQVRIINGEIEDRPAQRERLACRCRDGAGHVGLEFDVVANRAGGRGLQRTASEVDAVRGRDRGRAAEQERAAVVDVEGAGEQAPTRLEVDGATGVGDR